jgi:glycosyltransferase involved in cell wall biosynthesis
MRIGYLMQLAEDVRRPPYNGPANHVRQVCSELLKRGNQIDLLFRIEGKIWYSDDLQDFQIIDVRKANQGILRWIERITRRIQNELKLPYVGFFESLRFALACQQQLSSCDLLYERFSWMNFGGMIAKRILGIPWILEYNGDPVDDLEAKGMAPVGFQRKLSIVIMKYSMKHADHIIASGEGWRRNCVEHWGIEPEKISIVENGTDLVQLLEKDQLRAFQSVKPGATTNLVYLGGFYPWHGITILLQAVSKAISSGINLRLVLIGSGAGYQEAQKLTEDLGIMEFVKFTGQLSVEEYSHYLAEGDIGLSPYCGWVEYSGLKLFDYKAAGLACIASGKDGQPGTIMHGLTGWIVPPCDVDALLSAIQDLSINSELRQKIGKAARLDAERFHGWDQTVKKLEDVFSLVLTNNYI